ncbi:MAG TPA: hypothetical protein VG076_08145 [Acidimicrobiales bacterium]|jgi:hypothetical protein|nr:hypothetical protein [Acidimicrobiales bacterium]
MKAVFRARTAIGALLVGVAALVTPLVGATPAYALVVCPPNPAPGTTVNSNIYVPPGQVCTLDHNTVVGSITVASGAELIVVAGTINGNVTSSGANSVFIESTRTDLFTIHGSVTLGGVGNPQECAGRIDGSLNISNIPAVPPPPLAPSPGCFGPAGSRLTIGGDLNVSSNHSFYSFTFTTTGGSLRVIGNTGGGLLINDVAGGDMICSNSPPWVGGTLSAAGRNTCPG